MEKVYYADVVYFGPDTTDRLNDMFSMGQYVEMLDFAEQFDEGQEGEIMYISEDAYEGFGQIVDEDSEYALVREDITCTYCLKRKLTQTAFEEEDMRLDGKLTQLLNN